MDGFWRDEGGWVRLASPFERPAPGARASRVVVVVLPTAAALIVLRRRARRRAGLTAWRYRTNGEVSAENQRLADANEARDARDDALSAFEDDGPP